MTTAGSESERDRLLGFLDACLEALGQGDPSGLPLAEGARYTENGQTLRLGTGLWATAETVPDYHYVDIADAATGQVAWFGPISERGGDALTSLRVRVRDERIDEIEAIVRRQAELLYDPAGMAAPREIVFETIDPAERVSREELIDVAHKYFDGILSSNGDMIPVRDDCVRFENGVQCTLGDAATAGGPGAEFVIPLTVRKQIGSGYFAYMDDVRDRRAVAVDEERGLVLMHAVFDHSAVMQSVDVPGHGTIELPDYHKVPNSVLISELFKVRGGEIEHIEAVFEFLPYGVRTGWEEVASASGVAG